MKFTKHASALALAFVAASALASCGGHDGPSHSDLPEYDGSSEVTISFWNNYAEDPTPNDPSDDSNYRAYYYMKDMIAAFNAKYPNIHVETRAFRNYAAISTTIDQGIRDGNTPNLAITYGTYAYNWQEYLVDVTKKGEAMEKDPDINKNYLDAEKQQYGGKAYYTLPFGKSTESLMVNKDVFAATAGQKAGEEAGNYPAPVAGSTKQAYAHPETFADMMDIARKMKNDYPEVFATQTNDNGYFTAVPLIYETPENLFFTVMESAGIPYVASVDSASEGVLFNNADAKKAVVQLKKWNNEGLLCVSNNLYFTDEAKGYHAYPSTLFAEGKCFMIIATTRGSAWMAGDGYAVDYTKLPKWNASSTVKATSQGGSMAFFRKSNKQEEAASLLFYDFINDRDNFAKLSIETDYCPIRKSSYETESLKASLDAAAAGITASSSKAEKRSAYNGQVLNLNASYAENNELFMSPVNKYSSKLRSAVSGLITNVFSDKTAKSDSEIEALVDSEFAKAYQATVA